MDAQVRFECFEEEKARWVRAANQDGNRSLSSWIRARLNDAADHELPKPAEYRKTKKRTDS